MFADPVSVTKLQEKFEEEQRQLQKEIFTRQNEQGVNNQNENKINEQNNDIRKTQENDKQGQ